MIALSTAPVAPVVSVAPAPVAPVEARISREPPRNEAPIGGTLRLEASPPAPVLASLVTPSHPEPERLSPREQTALTADYLREAREAALGTSSPAEAAGRNELALASTELAPRSDDAAAGVIDAAHLGDTHRSVAPAFEPPPASTHAAANGPSSRGFEPVPVVRAPLAESLSSALGSLAELGGSRNPLPPASRPQLPPLPSPPRESGGRWLLLAAVALATVGVVSLGGRLWHRYQAHQARERAISSIQASAPRADAPLALGASSASHALLANRPARELPAVSDDGRVRVVSATNPAPPAAGESAAGASPESQLAATAARHVITGSYAEALPLYRQLERGWPENTSYAAVARLLEKKVGSRNDTRTIAPANSAPPRPVP